LVGRSGTVALLVTVCAGSSLAAPVTVAAAANRGATRAEAAVPLPPPRPAELGRRRDDVVLRGVTEAPTSAPAQVVTVATAPRALPQATRERMHACGLEWQQIKWSGSAGERTWRDFATECLPR
jgi:hypothetical protein